MRVRTGQPRKQSSGNAGRKRLAFLFLCLFLPAAAAGCAGRSADPEAEPAQTLTVPVLEPLPEEPAPAPAETQEELTPEERLQRDLEKGQIPWADAPRIGDRDSLIRYMRRVRDHHLTEAPVIYTDGYMADYEEILKAVNLAYIDFEIRSEEKDSRHVLYMLTYYPGDRVAQAYLSGNTNCLNEEERLLYDDAVILVEEAAKLPNDLYRELFLHDQVIGRATYHNRRERVGVPRFCTAVGAMLDGEANCQGYADAFAMLGTMAGLQVGRQSGFAGDDEHMWNTVFLNGRWYALDCTWDDASYNLDGTEYTSYAYFNAPEEILSATHSWEDYTVEHQVTESLADAPAYFYLTEEATDTFFGHYHQTMDLLAADAAARLSDGARYVYSMAPSEPDRFRKYTDVAEAVDAKLSGPLDYVVILTNRGGYSFVTIDAGRPEPAEGEETQSGISGQEETENP